MVSAFEGFKLPTPKVDRVPREFELDHIVQQVADGVPSEIDYVWSHFSYYDCLKVLMVQQYNNYVQDALVKAHSKNG